MKIFNWIRGYQFSPNVHSSEVTLNGDGPSGHMRRFGSLIGKGNAEKEPLLEQDANIVQSWEFEGILTIGTLAINPLKTINLHDEDDERNNNNEDVKQSYIYDYVPDLNNNKEMLLQDSKCEIAMCNLYSHGQRDAETKCNKENDVMDEEIVGDKMRKRVTLLDLFLADELEEKPVEEENHADDYGEDENGSMKAMKMKKKAIFYRKLGGGLGGKKKFYSKDKKLVPNDDIRLLKKLQRFVTRMMKKKIHPDMEARLQKKAQWKLNDDVPLGIDGLGANESASLLPINQGIMV